MILCLPSRTLVQIEARIQRNYNSTFLMAA